MKMKFLHYLNGIKNMIRYDDKHVFNFMLRTLFMI